MSKGEQSKSQLKKKVPSNFIMNISVKKEGDRNSSERDMSRPISRNEDVDGPKLV